MNVRRFALPFAALCFASFAATAANHTVQVINNGFVPDELTVVQGDTVTFTNNSGGLHNAQTDPGAPNSFRCANGCDGAGGNGSPSTSNWSATVTLNNSGLTRYFCQIHGGAGGAGMAGTIFVAATADPAPFAVADLVRLRVNGSAVDIDVIAHDRFETAALAGGSLTIVQAPGAGTATIVAGGDGTTPRDERVRYTPPANAAADTTLRYRLCDGDGECTNGDVRVFVRALLDDDLAIDAPADAGFVDVALAGLPALPEARFEVSLPTAPAIVQASVVADTTPWTPWDAGRAGTTTSLGSIGPPGDAQPDQYTVVVQSRPLSAGNFDLYIGADLDADDTPDENELRCVSAMSTGVERCEMRLDHPGTGTVRYWAMAQNRGPGTVSVEMEVAQLLLDPRNQRIVATGPGNLPAGAGSVLRVGWDDIVLLQNDVRSAILTVRPTPASDLGRIPVRLEVGGGAPVARALVSGRDLPMRLSNIGMHERLYIDVPPGATQLTATTTASGNVDLYLARVTSPAFPAIAAAPARGSADASSTGATGNETITIPNPAPGRWYVTPVNAGAIATDLIVRATVVATAPVVRSGSFFNPDRAGHGLFVYPAGNDTVWTVLWYHYFEDGSPTWYYLEGGSPGANGTFTSGVYRSAWDGDSSFLRQVGEATLVPTGPDAFRWSYTVDGRSGSEALVALGRECPTFGGQPRDSSSTWFDPATAGTGYSVQLFPNGYEYVAAFVYDGHGRPRYLAAERAPPTGGLVESYALEQLTGFCPLCTRTSAPARETIGTFTRTYTAAGRLERIEVDGVYVAGVPGSWAGDDAVRPLGGEETVQGCAP